MAWCWCLGGREARRPQEGLRSGENKADIHIRCNLYSDLAALGVLFWCYVEFETEEGRKHIFGFCLHQSNLDDLLRLSTELRALKAESVQNRSEWVRGFVVCVVCVCVCVCVGGGGGGGGRDDQKRVGYW